LIVEKKELADGIAISNQHERQQDHVPESKPVEEQGYGGRRIHRVEGFFSDPIYGGNKNKIAWKMIGFPGAYADYYDLIDKHGVEFHREPLSIADRPSLHSMISSAGGK